MRFVKLIRTILVAALFSQAVAAHSPHDVIDALATTDQGPDGTVLFAILAGNLLTRSQDGGTSWKDMSRGLDNRYSYTGVAAATVKHSQLMAFVATDGDGVYRSTDGGEHWATSNRGLSNLRLADIVISKDFANDRHVAAVGTQGGLFLSSDAGENWRAILDAEVGVTAVCFCEPGDRNTLLVGGGDGIIRLTSDGGKHWESLSAAPAAAGEITSIASLNAEDDLLSILISTEAAGVYRSDDAGRTLVQHSTGLTDLNVRDILVFNALSGRKRVLASTWRGGVFLSNDEGASWTSRSEGLTSDGQADSNPMHRSPHYRSLAVSYDGNAQPIVYLGAFTGLFASNQDAKRWTELESIPIKRIIDTAVSPVLDDDFDIALTTYGGGAYLLRDSEQQWRVMNRGLQNPRLTGVAFSPAYANDGKLFTASPGTMLIWNQQNNSWDRSSLRPGGFAAFKRWVLGKLRYHLKLPASITTDLLTATERNPPFPDAILPSATYSDDARVFVSSRRHGLLALDAENDDVDIIMPNESLVKDIVLSPNFALDQTMFATVQAEGVFRSTDAGSSWQSVNNGLEAIAIWQREIQEQGREQDAQQKEYFTARMAMGAAESGPGVLFLASGAGLFRSGDLGESWRHLAVPVGDGRDFAMAVAASPNFASDGTVIVSIKGQGLFLSEDGGDSFAAFARPLAAHSRAISQIQFSPRYATDATLYASSEEVLYRSRDAGTSWSVVARPVRYEDSRDVIRFSGDWQRVQGELMSGGSEMRSSTAGSRAAFRFVGSGVRWLGDAEPDLGAVNISLDGATLPVDALARVELNDGTVAYAIDKLEYGAHELVIELAEAAQGQVTVDALDVLGAQ